MGSRSALGMDVSMSCFSRLQQFIPSGWKKQEKKTKSNPTPRTDDNTRSSGCPFDETMEMSRTVGSMEFFAACWIRTNGRSNSLVCVSLDFVFLMGRGIAPMMDVDGRRKKMGELKISPTEESIGWICIEFCSKFATLPTSDITVKRLSL